MWAYVLQLWGSLMMMILCFVYFPWDEFGASVAFERFSFPLLFPVLRPD